MKNNNGKMNDKVEQKVSPDTESASEKRDDGGFSDDEYRKIMNESGVHVRAEYISPLYKAKMTITISNVTFNTACVKNFEGCQHVSFCIDMNRKCLLMLAEKEYEARCLKFANAKDGKNIPRICTAREFCAVLFKIMKWESELKFRVMVIYREIDGKRIMAFHLDEAQQVITEVIETKDGKKRNKSTVIMEEDWKNHFGYRKSELEERTSINISKEFKTIDPNSGAIGDSNIEPKAPTSESLMHEPYSGTKKTRKEKQKNDE